MYLASDAWSLDGVIKVSAADFPLDVGRHRDVALREPVSVTRAGRDSIALLSRDECTRLEHRDRQVLGFVDFTEGDIQAVRRTEPSRQADAFNHEVERPPEGRSACSGSAL